MPNQTKPMREVIYDRIMQGGATKEILLELADTTPKGLSSQFTYLRMMGRCPMLKDDKTYTIVTAEEWEKHRAEVSANSQVKTLSPEKRYEKASKRLERAVVAVDNATKRATANPDNELYDLQKQKATIEKRIAEIELDNAEHMLKKSGADVPKEPAEGSDEEPAKEPAEESGQAPAGEEAFA